MKTLATIILTLAVSIQVLATAQYPDKIIYNGQKYSLICNPLETFFESHPQQRPIGSIMSSALWRGYVATFEITDNQLFVKDIEIEVRKDTTGKSYDTEWKSVLSEVFPNQTKIKVDWFTGLLVIPYGEQVNYVHMGYGSTYENYILIEIDKGDFKKEKKYNDKEYEKFKERQYEAFKKTEEYKKLVEDLMSKDKNYTREFIDMFLKDFVVDYTAKILTE